MEINSFLLGQTKKEGYINEIRIIFYGEEKRVSVRLSETFFVFF